MTQTKTNYPRARGQLTWCDFCWLLCKLEWLVISFAMNHYMSFLGKHRGDVLHRIVIILKKDRSDWLVTEVTGLS